MKKLLLTAGILLCMLLTACKGKAILEEDKSGHEGEVVLYEENGIHVTLQASVSLENSGKHYVIHVINETEQERDVRLQNFVINDTIVVNEELLFYMDPLEEKYDTLTMVDEVLFWEEERIHSLSCHLEVEDENYETLDERDLEINLEHELEHQVLFNTHLGARAEEQVLIDNEYVKVTLLGWGRSPDDSYYVRGLFLFENKSEETIPVQVNGISLNGRFVNISDSVNFLKPGESCYTISSLLVSELEDEGFTYISDMQFMILTDEAQNTGTVRYSGGEWYPVELAEKAEETEGFETGKVLMSAENIEISLVEQTLTEWSTDDGGYYTWKLAVVNDSDENIRVAAINVSLDGIPEEEWGGGSANSDFYIAENDVGAHSKRYIEMSLTFEELIPQPELQLQFQIRSMAGGALIYTDDQMITITPDAQ